MKPSILVGGKDVIEGVMMRVPGAYATAVQDPEGTIHIQKKDFQSITERSTFWNKPVFRGMATLFEAMKMGMTTLHYYADIAMPEENKQGRVADFLSTIFSKSLLIIKNNSEGSWTICRNSSSEIIWISDFGSIFPV